jgi:hypothetical protein
MGMSEDGIIETFWVGGKRFVVAVVQLRRALEDAAIEEKAFTCGFD